MDGNSKVIRVMLAEDHPIVLLGLRTVVTAQPDMRLVAEAETAASVLELTDRLSPDLVVLPLRLEGELKGWSSAARSRAPVRRGF